MRFVRTLLLILLAVPFLAPAPGVAQETLDRPLRVFLDCNQFFCDQDFFTEEVPWVDFVRDRQSADVHVLGTRQTTGAGGSAYTLEFRGRDSFEGERLTLRTSTPPDATESERRDELVSVVRLGLVPFARATASAPSVDISRPATAAGEEAPAAQDDPWNRWVFSVGINGFAHGESQQRFMNAFGNTSASRVTEEWKIRFGIGGSTQRQEFEVDEITDVFQTESYSGNAMVVKSIGPHWGVGTIAEWRRSTFNNYGHSAAVGAAVEYNIFPYDESNRRLLTIAYAIGPRYNEYQEVTIFGETDEFLIHQILSARYEVTQPWGNIDLSSDLDHYVMKFSDGQPWEEPQYSASLSGGFNLRLIRGLSLRADGSISMIRNQIQLRLGDLTEQEILTRQRELATDYRYFMSFGLNYRFGSIFSAVVNPRFDEAF